MAKTKYVIGLDYGTLSGRAVLVEAATGEIAAQAVKEYPHAVMDRELPCGVRLEVDWALQHPQDYLDVLTETVPAAGRDCTPGSDRAFDRLHRVHRSSDRPGRYAALFSAGI